MNLPELEQFIQGGEFDKLKSVLEVSRFAYFLSDSMAYAGVPGAGNLISVVDTNYKLTDIKQYNVKGHNVYNQDIRKDTLITDDKGQIKQKKPVARIPIPEQKKIVMMAAAFLGIPELQSTPKAGAETQMFEVINIIREDNKCNYKFNELVKHTMSERECAELWFTEPAEPDYWQGTPMEGSKNKLRLRILAPSLGDTLYPVYDEFGDMVAFGRYYETVEAVASTVQTGDKTAHLDIYTKDRFYYASKLNGEWVHTFEPGATEQTTATIGIPNPLGKIPVIYYSQPLTEWHDVQDMINALEFIISNHNDTNRKLASPIVFAEGDVKGFADEGETGKVLIGKNGAKVSYLTWDNAPESLRMEVDNLIKFIHTYTHTPDISFQNIKGLGTFTGIALKMFFMDAHLKASDNEAVYGLGAQRSVNYLKAAIGKMNPLLQPAVRLTITPKFKYFLPKNEAEEIDNLIKCVNAGIMSIQTAVKLNPKIEDYNTELLLIRQEQDIKAKQDAAKLATQMAAQGKVNVGFPAN